MGSVAVAVRLDGVGVVQLVRRADRRAGVPRLLVGDLAPIGAVCPRGEVMPTAHELRRGRAARELLAHGRRHARDAQRERQAIRRQLGLAVEDAAPNLQIRADPLPTDDRRRLDDGHAPTPEYRLLGDVGLPAAHGVVGVPVASRLADDAEAVLQRVARDATNLQRLEAHVDDVARDDARRVDHVNIRGAELVRDGRRDARLARGASGADAPERRDGVNRPRRARHRGRRDARALGE